MTHAYSIDASSSDDTDWILLDFDEPAAESRKVRDTNVRDINVRDIRAAPLSRKPVKKVRMKKPQVTLRKTSQNTAEKAGKLKAASGKKRQRTRNPNSKQNRKTKV